MLVYFASWLGVVDGISKDCFSFDHGSFLSISSFFLSFFLVYLCFKTFIAWIISFFCLVGFPVDYFLYLNEFSIEFCNLIIYVSHTQLAFQKEIIIY